MQNDIFKKLRSQELFYKLPENILIHFSKKASLKSFHKGKVLFLHGEKAEWFFLIIHGAIKIYKETLDGSEIVMDIVSDGGLCGENSAFDSTEYTYSAELVEETQYIMMPISLLKYYVEESQQMALNLISYMTKSQKNKNREIEHLHIQNAAQRIGCFLLRLCEDKSLEDVTLELPYDKMLMAARLGMKPETFSRALSKLKNDLNIKIKGSTVTILSVKKLKDYTCNHCSQKF